MTVTIKGNENVKRFLKGFSKALKEEVKQATIVNSEYLQGEFVKMIDSGRFRKNKPITVAIKGRNQPLIDSGFLKNNIKWKLLNWGTSKVGFIYSKRNPKGMSIIKMARNLHDGYVIKYTPAMRAALIIRAANMGRDIRGKIKGKRRFWRVLPRPFMTRVIQRKGTINIINKNWNTAVLKSLGRFKAV